jgi:hypothetical protein
MPDATSDFVTNLINNVSFRPCANCGTLGFEPALRADPSVTSR